MKSKLYKNLDVRVKNILLISEGWLVGNSINNILNDEEVKDYDIIAPNRELYHKILFLSGSNYQFSINSYGGVKLQIDNYGNDTLSIDIWCEDLSHFIENAKEINYLYNYKRNVLLKNI